MGGLFDTSSRLPIVPEPINGGIQEYRASTKAWQSQSKRVKQCSSSIELLYKDITRLNLLLRFLKSPQNDLVLKTRLFTCVDIESKLSKLLWKFNSNTIIRCDFVNLQSLPPLSAKDKKELSQPSHPHQTPGFNQKEPQKQQQNDDQQQVELKEEKKQNPANNDNNKNNDDGNNKNEKKQAKVDKSFVLTINEFYYLFLFLEDKLPELAAWLMKQSEHNQNNLLLRALSAKKFIKEEENKDNNDDQDDNDNEEEQENKNEAMQEMIKGPKNEIEDEHCIICFEKMQNPICLTCGHEFCKECIDDWQEQIGGNDCPVCRCNIQTSQMW
eukprot:CAMPEP_0201572054 /NCGR_PEP_ID=MMETSP0190_2-20130828/15111_1 /ASSEMBLY_ACC=CAM_ASM_000263 /TAXON_ID=37353 /ORGANISM="Rosalina sp." /LENGTH=326 /DNA_ID=CAMNT_0047997359 /DNA_START=95 /DNA_END=1072 /DNA_ORIENTATION=+